VGRGVRAPDVAELALVAEIDNILVVGGAQSFKLAVDPVGYLKEPREGGAKCDAKSTPVANIVHGAGPFLVRLFVPVELISRLNGHLNW
jgi:hypothetical protein